MSAWKEVEKIHIQICQSKENCNEDLVRYLLTILDILYTSSNSCSHCNGERCSRDDDNQRCQCLIVLCLTTCRKIFTKQIPENSTVFYEKVTNQRREWFTKTLITLLDGEKFVRYTTQKTLVDVLQHPVFKDKVEYVVNGALENIKDEACLDEKKIARLELVGYLLSDEVESETRTVTAKVLCIHWDVLCQTFCVVTLSDKTNRYVLCEFLTVWHKLVKVLDMFGSDISQNHNTVLQNCVSLVDLLDDLCEEDLILSKIFHLLNIVYTYKNNSLIINDINPLYIDIGIKLLTWTYTRSFQRFSLRQNSWFGGRTIDGSVNNFSYLRIISLVHLKVTAMVLKSKHKTASGVSKIEDLTANCIIKLDKYVLGEVKTVCKKPFDWLEVVFSEQDDDWIEALLAILDIHLYCPKSWTTREQAEDYTEHLNAHQHFLKFVSIVDYDHSFILDLLTSPETCFLLYLTRYLRLMVSQWEVFMHSINELERMVKESKQIDSLNKRETFQNKSSNFVIENFLEVPQDNVLKSDGLIHKVNAFSHIEKTDTISSFGRSKDSSFVKHCDDEPEVEAETMSDIDNKTTVYKTVGLMLINNYDEEEQDDIEGEENIYGTEEERQKEEVKEEEIQEIEGNSLNGKKFFDIEMALEHKFRNKYIDKDKETGGCSDISFEKRNESTSGEDDNILNGEGSNEFVENNSGENLESGNDFNIGHKYFLEHDEHKKSNEHEEDKSDDLDIIEEINSDLDINEEINSLLQSKSGYNFEDSILDRVMTMFIRLRLKVISLWTSHLFPYDPSPLLSLIEQCELLYES